MAVFKCKMCGGVLVDRPLPLRQNQENIPIQIANKFCFMLRIAKFCTSPEDSPTPSRVFRSLGKGKTIHLDFEANGQTYSAIRAKGNMYVPNS